MSSHQPTAGGGATLAGGTRNGITAEQWDSLCSLQGTYCPFSWLTAWEQLGLRLDVCCDMIRLGLDYEAQALRQDLRRRFAALAAESAQRFIDIRAGTGYHRPIELPLIGKLATPAGVSAAAPKGAHQAAQRRTTA